jgi:hypothetical protein
MKTPLLLLAMLMHQGTGSSPKLENPLPTPQNTVTQTFTKDRQFCYDWYDLTGKRIDHYCSPVFTKAEERKLRKAFKDEKKKEGTR